MTREGHNICLHIGQCEELAVFLCRFCVFSQTFNHFNVDIRGERSPTFLNDFQRAVLLNIAEYTYFVKEVGSIFIYKLFLGKGRAKE